MKIRILSVLLAVAALAAGVGAKEISVLTVGNSFADSVFGYLPRITESAGDEIILERANIGGCSLERHCNEIKKSEADSSYKPYYEKFNLREKLESRKWDFVTIQQVSHLSWKPDSYQPFARHLVEYVKKYAPTAEIVIQQTWAYRFDDNRLATWKIDQKEMYKELTAAYDRLAAEMKLRVIPSGDAVQLARETQAKPYVPYDPATLKKLKHPDPLPSEEGSFVAGLWWHKNNDGSYSRKQDSYHLNKRGQYLQSCVWYGFFFGKPTSAIKFAPEGIAPEDAEFLRETAQKALDARKGK